MNPLTSPFVCMQFMVLLAHLCTYINLQKWRAAYDTWEAIVVLAPELKL